MQSASIKFLVLASQCISTFLESVSKANQYRCDVLDCFLVFNFTVLLQTGSPPKQLYLDYFCGRLAEVQDESLVTNLLHLRAALDPLHMIPRFARSQHRKLGALTLGFSLHTCSSLQFPQIRHNATHMNESLPIKSWKHLDLAASRIKAYDTSQCTMQLL